MDNSISRPREKAYIQTLLMQLKLPFGAISKVLVPELEEDKLQQQEAEEPPAQGVHTLQGPSVLSQLDFQRGKMGASTVRWRAERART